MNKSELINELATALAKAQGQMGAAKMDAVNPFLRNKYADLGSVIMAAKKPLSDNGLSYSQHPELADGKVTVTTVLMHSSGQWIESSISCEVGDEKGLSYAQSAGKVITYLRRYALGSIFGMYADEDTDGTDAGKKPAQKPQPQRQPEPAAVTAARELGGVATMMPNSSDIWDSEQGDGEPHIMTREEAENVTNSKGVRYGDLDTEVLEGMEHGINTGMKKPGADLATYNMKLRAIGIIKATRAQKEVQEDMLRVSKSIAEKDDQDAI